MGKYFRLLRVKHYIKNFLIFLPAFLTRNLLDVSIMTRLMTGFLIYSFAASVVYIVNDLRDAEKDRAHPTKCRRPIAAGEVSTHQAVTAIVCLLVLMAALSVGHDAFPRMLLLPTVYLVLNLGYSFGLKNVPLLDVFILMLGYLLRLEYGGWLAGCGVSKWMFLTMMFVAFFLGFGKRRGELLAYGTSSRESLKQYSADFLEKGMYTSLTAAIVFYALMCADTNTVVARYGADLLWSVPFVALISFRYMMLIEGGRSDGDPVSVVLSDKILVLLCAAFSLVLLILLYFPVRF